MLFSELLQLADDPFALLKLFLKRRMPPAT
jgi:hypothetical protein